VASAHVLAAECRTVAPLKAEAQRRDIGGAKEIAERILLNLIEHDITAAVLGER
jgi:hypothetical protein